MEIEQLVEIRHVTERFPTGEIKTTSSLGETWLPVGTPRKLTENTFWAPLSTDRMLELTNENRSFFRKVKIKEVE